MFITLKKRIKNEKGLSLVELLAVIVILAIVAAIAIPAIGNIIDNSRIKGIKADVANIVSAAQIYYADTGTTTGFVVNGSNGVGDKYVNLGSASVTTPVAVDSTGKMTAGVITKSGKTLTISGTTTLEELKIDDSNVTAVEGKWKIENKK
ncbi:prepilin-type N-terminal cleavage/methylation domain-containing protein [Solibacillus isronensis]|uniref:prepilin-type N-terminal cleavage/methylation domain-containing protein n=1 Tax=Solibacillus isronensis TaxID=412383 RepID=UPI0009A56B7A|nr:prepilin-type N-terminal cleavage/methylation domain-containing protein [Solibacillus isronensis]